jgi:hypothetical protein
MHSQSNPMSDVDVGRWQIHVLHFHINTKTDKNTIGRHVILLMQETKTNKYMTKQELIGNGACRSVSDFDKIRQLGEGTYGIVYEGREKKNGQTVIHQLYVLILIPVNPFRLP